MSRLADAILTGAFAAGRAPMLNPQYGGQNGFAPNLAEWVSNQSYVSRPLVCLLVEAPRGFQYLPDPQFWVSALKSMVELHPKSIDGFAAGLSVDVSENNAVGGAGEMQQDPLNVTRARSNPSFSYIDKYGRPIQNFVSEWITNLIMDPDSKVPNIATSGRLKPADLLADMYGATMLFFEPDPLHATVNKAWLTTNMYPKLTGDITGKRDLTAGGENSEFTIDFTGISQSTLGVRAFAQSILTNINLTNANPNLRPAFVQKIDSEVAAAGRGYGEQIKQLADTAILRQ
jgi:hypothetical protein